MRHSNKKCDNIDVYLVKSRIQLRIKMNLSLGFVCTRMVSETLPTLKLILFLTLVERALLMALSNCSRTFSASWGVIWPHWKQKHTNQLTVSAREIIAYSVNPGLEIHFFLVVANFCYQVQDQVAKQIFW